MISVSARFEELRARGQAALIPFITAGDPNLMATAKALRVLDQNGADLIELGVPYSDPLADAIPSFRRRRQELCKMEPH